MPFLFVFCALSSYNIDLFKSTLTCEKTVRNILMTLVCGIIFNKQNLSTLLPISVDISALYDTVVFPF